MTRLRASVETTETASSEAEEAWNEDDIDNIEFAATKLSDDAAIANKDGAGATMAAPDWLTQLNRLWGGNSEIPVADAKLEDITGLLGGGLGNVGNLFRLGLVAAEELVARGVQHGDVRGRRVFFALAGLEGLRAARIRNAPRRLEALALQQALLLRRPRRGRGRPRRRVDGDRRRGLRRGDRRGGDGDRPGTVKSGLNIRRRI